MNPSRMRRWNLTSSIEQQECTRVRQAQAGRAPHQRLAGDAGGLGNAGGGAVRVVAFCDLRIESITLDPAVFRGIATGSSADQSYANRMIADAVNDALLRARARVAEEIGRAAKESGIDLPANLLEQLG